MDITKISAPNLQSVNNFKADRKQNNPVAQIGSTFEQALEGLNQSQEYSDNLIQQLAAGEDVDIHNVMIAAEQTDINFRIAVAIRDKLVDAYREIMRMSV